MSNNNVIWIISDQHRAQCLSINGDPNLNTPNIDAMGALGLNFTQAVSGFPLCCPFRGSMLTGRYPHLCIPGHEYPLPEGMPTIAHILNEHGYETAYFGKWHVAGLHESEGRTSLRKVSMPMRGGFTRWLGYENNNSQWDSWVHGHDTAGTEIPHYRLPGYETDALTDHFLDYLKEKKNTQADKPFFAVLSVQPPHDPYVAPPQFMARHNPERMIMRENVPRVLSIMKQAKREYAGSCAMIENLDYNIGRVIMLLRETGLYDSTHILFFSDHGDMHGSHGLMRKTNPFEEAVRIPFVMGGVSDKGYNGMRSGSCSTLINHVDIAPTTLGLCGVPVPESMQGTDLSAVRLERRSAPAYPDSVFLQSVIPTGHGSSIDRPWRGIITHDRWKYVALDSQPWLLFNLTEDPYEQVNHAFNTSYAAERKKLNNRLARWISDTGDTFNLPAL
ncbi:MAG: hypothetical protein A2096_15275 [Spirochaetes bacterium GWF1_41_5]|nr:MAG: hypothetical protein A2096_15275 [Spirochaetes bacterium GWF1_41_5]HBE02177.1 hypothetical protein [Spirochaetia bacterium]